MRTYIHTYRHLGSSRRLLRVVSLPLVSSVCLATFFLYFSKYILSSFLLLLVTVVPLSPSPLYPVNPYPIPNSNSPIPSPHIHNPTPPLPQFDLTSPFQHPQPHPPASPPTHQNTTTSSQCKHPGCLPGCLHDSFPPLHNNKRSQGGNVQGRGGGGGGRVIACRHNKPPQRDAESLWVSIGVRMSARENEGEREEW